MSEEVLGEMGMEGVVEIIVIRGNPLLERSEAAAICCISLSDGSRLPFLPSCIASRTVETRLVSLDESLLDHISLVLSSKWGVLDFITNNAEYTNWLLLVAL